MSDQKNLILAIALSAVVVFGWQYFFAIPKMEQERARQAQNQSQSVAAAQKSVLPALPRAQAIAQSGPRIHIDTPTLDGSIDLTTGRFDDLKLKAYRETLDPKSPEIELLSPDTSEHPYYADVGWLTAAGTMATSQANMAWHIEGNDTLSPGKDVSLTYDNGQGLIFHRRISVDNQYMFVVTDSVQNTGTAAESLYPFALVSRRNVPQSQRSWVLHEGFIGVGDGTLKDKTTYDDLGKTNGTLAFQSTDGWVGITDKYWMAAIIPPQMQSSAGEYKAFDEAGVKAYQSDYRMDARMIAPGGTTEVTHRIFAGAKVVSMLRDYRDNQHIPYFDYAVDWGWFYFFTQPIFLAIDYVYRYVGNFGVAILIFTVFMRLLFFPLASTSFRAMAKMKKLQPEMERLKEQFKEDKAQLQQGMMELYKKEKVNPMAGCVPMLVQIPVFFSLYKVLFVTIEMRHAPFYGWIQDLSSPDPTSVFNLFGLIPVTLPHFLIIGVWPLLMGVTMWIQTNLNPPQGDPTQQKIFQYMPLVFTLMLANLASGLVIYWTWSNVLAIIQQVAIMRSTGTPIALVDRVLDRFKGRRPA